MAEPLSRRDALKQLGAVGAGVVFADAAGNAAGGSLLRGVFRGRAAPIVVNGQPVEIAIASLSAATVRITVRPLRDGNPVPIPDTGALANDTARRVLARSRTGITANVARAGDLYVTVTDNPPTLVATRADHSVVQRLTLSATAPTMSFLLGDGPLLGLGQGGPQFDRKGSVDRMINGQGGYRLATHGGRMPIQWMVGTAGWAMFIHQPYGTFDFSGAEGVFTPKPTFAPLDIYVVASKDPRVIMREYARITGLPELPPLWGFGYLQSHRTLGGQEEILRVARTFREKKLPCDALIYLGTEFAPSGWNTRNGEFTWHPENFPDPPRNIAALHAEHMRVVLHTVIEGKTLTGRVTDPCTADPLPSGRTPDNRWPPDRQVSCYWPVHIPILQAGVDGWWPDQGDGLDGPSELARQRMYAEGTQKERPNARVFSLHRNASAGVQRFGSFIWSGDVQSRWETLKTHVSVAINTGLSGLPFWGTDIGGFIPTPEFTGELYARWFQFGAFCPLFRSHGRNWHLRLPWGWNSEFLGDGGPFETGNWRADPAELHNAAVELVCKKYLELRYRLMPYLYTAVREAHDAGMPIMRSLWLHHPDDAEAVARGDEYLWGRDVLVAPVVEKGATSRRLYLPKGVWYDFWTEERVEGGREIDRAVDLATMPLYVRAGAVLPMGPVRQYTDEPSDEPLTMVVFPGADGEASWYEDDGKTFNHRRGEFMRVTMHWKDSARRLSLRLAAGSRMLAPAARAINVRVAGSQNTTSVTFAGKMLDVTL